MSDPLLLALSTALAAQGSPWAGAPLERLKDKGLAHDHVRLCGTGVMARIPKQSQMGLAAGANLAYQSACFERAAAGGHTPNLFGVLTPCVNLPRGALLVEDIVGHNAALPKDLSRIVLALASLHSLALPDVARRPPLINAVDPLKALIDEISDQARHAAFARLDESVQAILHREMASLRMICARDDRPPRHLIAFDGHPGNFIIRHRADAENVNTGIDSSMAILVDLEKCRYSYPGLDLAHVTLYTSTTWDMESHAVLSVPEILGAYTTWASAMEPANARDAHHWHLPLRRAMWLWSITWCAKWRVVSTTQTLATSDGEDWSTARSDVALVRHVRDRVDHYLSPDVVQRVSEEFDLLDTALYGRA